MPNTCASHRQDRIDKTPALIFDFGGVLMDWDPFYLFRKYLGEDRAATERFLREIGFAAWNHSFDEGVPMARGVAELCARFPGRRGLIEAYLREWPETLGGSIRPSVEILRALRQAGYPLYGLTNWSAETFPPVRARYEFFSWFLDIVVSGEEGVAKPDPRIFQVLLQRSERQAGQCLFVDDNQANIGVARELGFQTIHFRSPDQLGKELRQRGLLG